MKERTYTVYIHRSPTNKCYVGITHIKPEYRWNEGRGYQQNKHFYSAIQKYGWENFEHIIVARNLPFNVACEMEQHLISELKSNQRKYGYNKSVGGEKTALGAHYTTVFSDAHKKALSDAWIHRKEKGLGVPWNKGKHLKGTGILDNFIKAGKQNSENKRKSICQIDPVTKEVVATYISVTEAANTLGKTYNASISRALHTGIKAHGYYWKINDI